MLTTWLGTLGGKFTSGWADVVLTPSVVFWAACVGVYQIHPFGPTLGDLESQLSAMPVSAQVLAAIGVLAVIGGTELVLRLVTVAVTRLMEGYWPWLLGGLSLWLAGVVTRNRDKDQARLDALLQKYVDQGQRLDDPEARELVALDMRLRDVPAERGERKPTRFGNIIRAAEARIRACHGLDPIVSWGPMWLVVPDSTRTELTQARSNLDTWVRVWMLGLLFALSAVVFRWWPPAVVGLFVALVVWFVALRGAARTYAGLQEAAFDVHWRLLYTALGWEPPKKPSDEAASGQEITIYLWRGGASPTVKYAASKDAAAKA